MRLHSRIAQSNVNGPGERAVVWFQGCNLGCPGCWNPETHTFTTADTPIESVEAWLYLLYSSGQITGVTFSGGEPVQHFPDLLRLCEFVRGAMPGVSVGMFTGYTLRELEAGRWMYVVDVLKLRGFGEFTFGSREHWAALAPLLDFAVCGRYNARQHATAQPLCGSANQVIHLLSPRYALADFAPQLTEVCIDDGFVQVTGFPNESFLTQIKGA